MTFLVPSRGFSLRFVGYSLLLLLLARASLGAAAIQVISGGRDHVVYPDEPGRIRVLAKDPSVAWSIRDFVGCLLASGNEPAPGGVASIAVPIHDAGYYTIDLSGSESGAVASTSWAVVRPAEARDASASPFGVMTHFAQGWDLDIIPLMKKDGIVNARDEAYWKFVEPKRGLYTFPGVFDAYMEAFQQSGIVPLIPLTFENPHFDGGQTPYTADGIDGYVHYAEKVVEHYGAQLKAVEIWNEYNGSFANGPAANARPQTYVAMLKRAYAALKKVQPTTTVVGGSTINIPLAYFEQMFQNGALDAMDVVSVHPYRYAQSPEGLEGEISALGTLINKYAKGTPKPIWITEIGWPVHPAGGPGDPEISEATQAKYLARAFSLCLAGGAEKIYWYLLRDYSTFPSMGLLRNEFSDRGRFTPKPSFVAYSVIARQLSGARFVRREPSVANIYSLLFRRGVESIRVIWSLEPTAFTVQADGPVRISNLVGAESLLVPDHGKVTFPLADAPCYVVGAINLPPAPTATQQVIADSAQEFSEIQGAKGWFYGVYDGTAKEADRFKAMPSYRTTDYGGEWADGAPYALISASLAHPGTFSAEAAAPAVRRWVSGFKGMVTAAGELTRLSNLGDGVNASVYVDGVAVYTQKLGGGQPLTTHFSVTFSSSVGTKVDFVIDPGASNDVSYDQTKFTAILSHE